MSAAVSGPPEAMPPLGVWIGVGAMLLGSFLAMLDVQIVASSIGAIQAGVGATRDEISWVQTAYLIAEVIAIPLAGFLVRAMSTRILFAGSAVLFTIFSLACALSWDIQSLIVFRALQGFFGAAMIPTTVGTAFLVFPRRMQPMTSAIVAMVATSAPALGPTLGGWISETWSWHALFWLNVIPGVFVAWAVWRWMRVDEPHFEMLKRIDFPNLLGLALMLGCAQYLLEEGPKHEWFASAEITWLAAAAGFGAVLFFWRSIVSPQPVVDLRPFTVPTFAIGACLGVVLGIVLFGATFLQPLFLSEVRGFNSLQIGHFMFAQGLTMFLVSPLIGVISQRMSDVRILGAVGFLLVAWSCWMQAHMTAQTGFWEFVVPQILRGIGLMATMSTVMQPSISALPPHLVHSGAGLFNTMRNLGGAFGLATLVSAQQHSFALHRQELYSAAHASDPNVQAMIAMNIAHLESVNAANPERQALMRYASLLDREALVMTFNDMFFLVAVVVAAAACSIVLMRAPRSQSPQAAEAAAGAH